MAIGGFIFTINYGTQYFFPTSFSYHQRIDSTFEGRRDINRIRENERTRSLRSSINSFALFAVSAPIFAYHWKKAEAERKESEVE